MTTYVYSPQFDDGEIIALTQIIEASGHPQARYLLDRLYRSNATLTSQSGEIECQNLQLGKECGATTKEDL